MNTSRIHISLLGYGASWSGPAEQTPWSVFTSPNGVPVLDGGVYPDQDPNADLLVKGVTQEQAEEIADALQQLLMKLAIESSVEMLGDG